MQCERGYRHELILTREALKIQPNLSTTKCLKLNAGTHDIGMLLSCVKSETRDKAQEIRLTLSTSTKPA